MKNFVMKMLIKLIVSICLNDFFTSVSTVDDSISILHPFQPVTESFIDNEHILRTDIEYIISTLDIDKVVGPD